MLAQGRHMDAADALLDSDIPGPQLAAISSPLPIGLARTVRPMRCQKKVKGFARLRREQFRRLLEEEALGKDVQIRRRETES